MADTTVQATPTDSPASALRRLLRRKLALFGLAIITLVVGGAALAPWIAPYAPDEIGRAHV